MSEELLISIASKLDDLGKNLKEFKEETSKKIGSIDQRFDSVDKKLEIITQQVVKNSEQITELAENQNLLIAGQARQDKILGALALRSLEQESDIRHMQRAN